MGLCPLQGGFSAIICDSMNQLLHIIGSGEGSRYFNYLIIPTDLTVPASVVMREKSQGSLRENVGDRIGSFPVCCFLSSEGPETPRVMKDGAAISSPREMLSLLASQEGHRLSPDPLCAPSGLCCIGSARCHMTSER